MKKPKTVKPFYFKGYSKEEVSSYLNNNYPINLKFNSKLIDRIHKRYPYLNKSEISFIIIKVFESFRDLLILGKVLNFNTLFFDMKLHFFPFRWKKHILPSLKVKISTPPPMRKK